MSARQNATKRLLKIYYKNLIVFPKTCPNLNKLIRKTIFINLKLFCCIFYKFFIYNVNAQMMLKRFEQDISKMPNGIWSFYKYDYILSGEKKSKFLTSLKRKKVFVLKNEKTFTELETYRINDEYDWLKFSWKYRAICFNYKLELFGLKCTSLCTFEYLQEYIKK